LHRSWREGRGKGKSEMRNIDLIAAASEAISAAKKGGPFEDSGVEFKAQFPKPDDDAARRIAGMANAIRGEQFIMIVGVDNHGKVWGADEVELASWCPQVKKHFDGPMPKMIRNVNFPFEGKTVTALCFGCSETPYMVTKGESREIPWREGNRTRAATREELIALFSESGQGLKMPSVEVLDKALRAQYDSTGKVARLTLHVDLYVTPKGEKPLVFPRHKCSVSIIKARRRFKSDKVWPMRSKTEREVQPQTLFDMPGPLYLIAFFDSPSSLPDGSVTVEISLQPVYAPSPVITKCSMNMEFPGPPHLRKLGEARRDHQIPGEMDDPAKG